MKEHRYIKVGTEKFSINDVSINKMSANKKEKERFADVLAELYGHLFADPNDLFPILGKLQISLDSENSFNYFIFDKANDFYYLKETIKTPANCREKLTIIIKESPYDKDTLILVME